jgi:hypothetical protein
MRGVAGRTVVMGSAVGLTWEQVRPLLSSLEGCGYSGDIALFVTGRLHRDLRHKNLPSGLRLVRIRSLIPVNFRRIFESRALWALWRPVQTVSWTAMKAIGMTPLPTRARDLAQATIARMVCTPMDARFFHYLRFLECHPYDRIVLTDVRDVLFQHDPFDDLSDETLAVSLETRRYTIASEPHNRRWLETAFGQELVDRIGANPVSCVGVTYGGLGSMSAYLRSMTREMRGLSASVARNGGADTSVHNALLWTGELGAVRELDTLASPVATLNGITAEELAMSPRGTLLNGDGSEPSIVHQYDRVSGLAPTLLATLTT